MLSPTVSTLRLLLHILAASVWVGGQIVLGGLVPTLRKRHPDAVKTVAAAFARIAWPAFFVAVATGIWNLAAVKVASTSNAYQVTVMLKILLAIVSGVGVAAHQFGRGRVALIVGGAVGLLASLAALALGVLLRTGG